MWEGFWAVRATIDGEASLSAGMILDWSKLTGQIYDQIDGKTLLQMDAQFRDTLSQERAFNIERQKAEQGRGA